MEQTNSSSSNDVSANYRIMIGDHQLLCTAGGHQMHPNVQNFSMGAPQYQHPRHLHVAALPPPTSEPFEGEGCETPVSSYMRCRSSSALNQRLVANVAPQNNNFETILLPHGRPDRGAMGMCTSPEGLLDVISVAQKKLQQLQAVVELMVQVGGQTQQQQSLAAGMKSIMSQLFVATAGLRQQREAPWSNQVSGSCSQLNEAMDLRFDGFCSDDAINPMGSFVRSSWDGFFPSSNSCPGSMGPELTSSAMELGPFRGVTMSNSSASKGPELTDSAVELVSRRATEASKPSGVMDLRHKEQVLSPPLSDPAKHLAHSRAQNKPVEIENGSLVEACDRQVMSRNGNKEMFCLEDHDYPSVFRDDDDDGEVENLPPGSYELVEMAATEILAEHTHFCEMCGKGFKRDANLRMHMRGHGDEYKTPAALARPNKCSPNPSMVKLRRYSCPYVGCKRNKKHRKFQPLKTILCVKNHYRRSHCPKLLTCNKCRTKKFSVVADLKTHEKHCGEDKWHCSCGTTFSRKDKLVGHIGLFVGHTPGVPLHEMEGVNGCGEPTFAALLPGEGEGLDLSLFESPPALPGSGLNTALMSGNELDIPELTVMGKVLVSDDNGQQLAFHRGEKSFFAENSPRSAMEVMQHYG